MLREMTNDTTLIGFPRILTPRRLASVIGLPLLLASLAAGLAGASLVTGATPLAIAAIAWATGAIFLMRPDPARETAAIELATERLRAFLATSTHLRRSRLSAEFLATVNPLESEYGWPALVALGGLPRGGWTLLAVPAVLAVTALILGATILLAPLGLGATLLAVLVASMAVLLGLDAHASTVRSALVPFAAEAAVGLRRTLIIIAAIEEAFPGAATAPSSLPSAPPPADIA
jgi:hypothetical protein